MYRENLRKAPYELFKFDYHMLHVLFDQYHRAMKMLDEEQKDEDLLLKEFNVKSRELS